MVRKVSAVDKLPTHFSVIPTLLLSFSSPFPSDNILYRAEQALTNASSYLLFACVRT
jgi:hypothetical protein